MSPFIIRYIYMLDLWPVFAVHFGCSVRAVAHRLRLSARVVALKTKIHTDHRPCREHRLDDGLIAIPNL